MKKAITSCNGTEKWIILVVVLILVCITTLLNFSEFGNFVSSGDVFFKKPPVEKIFKSSFWFDSIFKDIYKQVKFKNVFNPFEIMSLDTLNFDLVTREHSIDCLGDKSLIVENMVTSFLFKKEVKNKIKNSIIFFVKAVEGHSISKNKLQYVYKFEDGVREATHILYCFGTVDWKFDENWIFCKHLNLNRHYAPENNSIICFNKNDEYELSPLISKKPRYFMVILIFEDV